MGYHYQSGYKNLMHHILSNNEVILGPLALKHASCKRVSMVTALSIGLHLFVKQLMHDRTLEADQHAAQTLRSSEPVIHLLLSQHNEKQKKKKPFFSSERFLAACKQTTKIFFNLPPFQLLSSKKRVSAQRASHNAIQYAVASMKPIANVAKRMCDIPLVKMTGFLCSLPYACTKCLYQSKPTVSKRVHYLMQYHEEHFNVPLTDDLQEKIKAMDKSACSQTHVMKNLGKSFSGAAVYAQENMRAA
jgi:hypothetical protein